MATKRDRMPTARWSFSMQTLKSSPISSFSSFSAPSHFFQIIGVRNPKPDFYYSFLELKPIWVL